MTLLSVIVACYNHESYVEDALMSVYRQTHQDIQLVVIDDCSTDNSEKVIRRVMQKFSEKKRFHHSTSFVIHRENCGAAKTLNEGVDLAIGDYITILNSDDIYHSTRLETLLEKAGDHESFLGFTRVGFIDELSRIVVGANKEKSSFRGLQDSIGAYPSVGFSFLGGNVAITSGNIFFSRNIAESGVRFKNDKYCHDWGFVLDCLPFVEPEFIDEDLYYYRIHDNNSFRSLSMVAENETASVLSRFVANSFGKNLENGLAPTRENWPYVYDLVSSACGFHPILR